MTLDHAVGLPSDRRTVRDVLGLPNMKASHDSIRVLQADRYDGGVLIVFAEGKSVVYTPEFLYEHRGTDGNWEVADDPGAL